MSAIAVGLLLRGVTSSPATSGRARARRGIVATLIAFSAISLIFALKPGLVALSLSDPVYLGHQAREVFTNALVTIPLGFFFCARAAEPPRDGGRNAQSLWTGAALLAFALAIALYIAQGALAGDALGEAQSTDMRVLIFPHFFEHAFTYVVASCVAVGTFLTLAK